MTTVKQMKNTWLLATIVAMGFTACGPKNVSKTTGQSYNDAKWGGFANPKYKGQETGPGLVLVEGGNFVMGNTETDLQYDNNNVERSVTVNSFYMDETEVSNLQYREYTYWLMRVYNAEAGGRQNKIKFAGQTVGEEERLFEKALPDTNCWRQKDQDMEKYFELYHRHPAYQDYPVVGVSWLQASDYCAWRTDLVN